MKSKNILFLLIILVIAFLGYSFYKGSKNPSIPQENSKTAVIDKSPKNTADESKTITKAEVKDIIKEEIKDNPSIVISAIESHMSKQQTARDEKIQQLVVDFKDQLLNDKNDPTYGNSNAKNSIVSFYDYNCGYCKKMSEVLKQIVDNKQDVYIVFKELPILGANSLKASKLALAVYKIAPEKFLDFHFALMEDSSNNSLDQKVKSICKTLKIDTSQLYKQIDDTSIQSALDQNLQIAKGIGFRSTPTVIINDQLIPGFINYDRVMSIMDSNNTVANVDTVDTEKKTNDNDDAIAKVDTNTNVTNNSDVAKVDTNTNVVKDDTIDVKSNAKPQDNDSIDSVAPAQKKQ
jgi:protein-disulfide isomerase